MARFCSSCGAPLEEDAKFCEQCGTAQTVGHVDSSQPAKIQLARKWRFVDLIFDEEVYIDEVKVGAISNGQTKTFEVSPGTHKLQLKMTYPLLSCFLRSRPTDIHINHGDTLKFTCDFIFGAFSTITGLGFFNYPVLQYYQGFSDFTLNYDFTGKVNNVMVLDVKTVIYHDGYIYCNILSLSRSVEYYTDGDTTDGKLIEKCHPHLGRFMIVSSENLRNGKYKLFEPTSSQNITIEDVGFIFDVLGPSWHMDFLKCSDNAIKNYIKQWYDVSMMGKEDFRKDFEYAASFPTYSFRYFEVDWLNRFGSEFHHCYGNLFLITICKLLAEQ